VTPFLTRKVVPSPTELASALRSYAARQTAMLTAWSELVAHLYDGRMVALLHAGRDFLDGRSGVLKTAMQNHIERHIAMQASGAATTSRYSRGLLRLLSRYGLRGIAPAPLAIK
jgi:hypothetical protein